MTPPTMRQQDYKATWGRVHRSHPGMTLVELLVVLAILSILAALVLPVFRAGITFAQRTSCVSNMHQASLALSMYSQDYDQQLPNFRADPSSAVRATDLVYWHDHFCRGIRLNSGEVNWASLVTPYASSAIQGTDAGAVFHCPADRDREARPVTSYEYKMLLADQPNLSAISAPANMAMLWEQWAYHTDAKLSEYDRRASMNVVFVDDHAHWIRLSDTTTATFGNGPDLHWIFVGTSSSDADYTGQDIIAQ
jgi:prepilin-type N-terminal cleavage/methylation domain-containing protein